MGATDGSPDGEGEISGEGITAPVSNPKPEIGDCGKVEASGEVGGVGVCNKPSVGERDKTGFLKPSAGGVGEKTGVRLIEPLERASLVRMNRPVDLMVEVLFSSGRREANKSNANAKGAIR
ncbi:MAG: hypothetical protein ABH863_06190 [Candidatus Micrarchaeota archaeon]